jgi:hypothetical protein
MKIKKVNGSKFNGDNLYLVETKGEEPITIYRLFLLINQIALNESKRYKKYLPSLLFENFMQEAIWCGKMGIDFLNNKNDELLKGILIRCYPREGKYKFNLYKQSRINDFGVKDGSP